MPSYSDQQPTRAFPEDGPAVPAPQPSPQSASAADLASRPAPARARSLSSAAWTALVVGVVALVFVLIFVLQNNVPTQLTLLAWTFTLPLGVAALFAAIGGALITAGVGTVRMIVLGRSVRHLRRDAARVS